MRTEEQLQRAARELLRLRGEPDERAFQQALDEVREADLVQHALEVGASCE